jgi:hypothetical protein
LEREIFLVLNFFLLMNYFNYPCFWEMVVNNVFFFLCRNCLDIVHLIVHITFHLHNCIVYFLSTLHFFKFQLFVNVKVDFHIVAKYYFGKNKLF